jgi:hydroxyethylthiazole kinase-like uncharacterized protein yjeF
MDVLRLEQFAEYLKPRDRDSHKGHFGHVLVIGGDAGFSGAAFLAAVGALRVGAGLVSVATRPEHAKVLNLARPELMCHAVATWEDLKPCLTRATVLVVGPGFGRSAWSRELLGGVLRAELPLILDADGLNLLAENLLAEGPIKKSNWILTPHPGEAARLLKTSSEEIQQDRLSAVKKLQQTFGGWVVLKGAGSFIAGPNEVTICKAGNPGMASGGMGDVLSGVLGGLLGQGIPMEMTAKLGVLIHALAGDMAAKEGERGMIASDLLPYLRKIVNKWS